MLLNCRETLIMLKISGTSVSICLPKMSTEVLRLKLKKCRSKELKSLIVRPFP